MKKQMPEVEIKKIKVPTYKKIIDGYEDVDIYITSDGEKFPKYRKNDARRHQYRLYYEERLSKIKKITIENIFERIPSEWFYVSNNEELNFLVCLKEDRYREVEVYGNLQIGEWIGKDTLDCGDSGESIAYYTLSYIMNECTNFLLSAKNMIKD